MWGEFLFVTSIGKIWLEVPLCRSGCSSCCWGWDLHQTEPEDWWVHPAGRLWMEHGWVGRSSLRVPHGPHQLPALHFPGLHSPPSKSVSLPHCSRCLFLLDSVSVGFFPPLTLTLSCFIWLHSCLCSVTYLCCTFLCIPGMLCWRTPSACRLLSTSCCNVTLLWISQSFRTSGGLLQCCTSSLLYDWCPCRQWVWSFFPLFSFLSLTLSSHINSPLQASSDVTVVSLSQFHF